MRVKVPHIIRLCVVPLAGGVLNGTICGMLGIGLLPNVLIYVGLYLLWIGVTKDAE